MSKYSVMRNRAYSEMETSKRIEKYRNILGDGMTAKRIAKSIESHSNTEASIDAIIQLFKVLFRIKGFSEEEAIKYLVANKYIFEKPYGEILTTLSIIDTVDLSDEAVFEKPSFVQRSHNVSKLYDSVRIARESGNEVTLDVITELELNETRETKYKLEKSRADMYRGVYKAKLAKKLKEQQESKGAVLTRTEE